MIANISLILKVGFLQPFLTASFPLISLFILSLSLCSQDLQMFNKCVFFLRSKKLDKSQPLVPGMDPVTLPGPNQPPPPGTEPLDNLPSRQPSGLVTSSTDEGYLHPDEKYKADDKKVWSGSSNNAASKGKVLGENQYNGGSEHTVYCGPEQRQAEDDRLNKVSNKSDTRNKERLVYILILTFYKLSFRCK